MYIFIVPLSFSINTIPLCAFLAMFSRCLLDVAKGHILDIPSVNKSDRPITRLLFLFFFNSLLPFLSCLLSCCFFLLFFLLSSSATTLRTLFCFDLFHFVPFVTPLQLIVNDPSLFPFISYPISLLFNSNLIIKNGKFNSYYLTE